MTHTGSDPTAPGIALDARPAVSGGVARPRDRDRARAQVAPRRATSLPLGNEHLARNLERIAELLEEQEANPFRVRAYARAAETVRGLPRPVHRMLALEGREGLTRLPGIGASLARAIVQLVETGRLTLLDRLEGYGGADELFATVPGLGPELARRIHDELGIESLAELEAAAHDGRLERVHGVGEKRLRGVVDSLAGRFGRSGRRAGALRAREQPPVAELLDVDREYRERARAGRLPRIAPRRFNPAEEAWLPVLHTVRGDRHYTALFSNTARAHELGTTRDWVVLYRDDPVGDGQWTVVTERSGPLAGRRVVRGREAECRATDAEGPAA